MMRSLWTSASGMTAQMLKIDTVTNNMANVNTTGFKRERLEFKTLLYESMRRADLDPATQTGRPVNLEVGHGVRPANVTRIFTQGSLQRTDRPLDFAIHGAGFFQVRRGEDYFYTRDGTFHIAPQDDGTLMLATSDGFPVISVDGDVISIPGDTSMRDIIVNEFGVIMVINEENLTEEIGYQIRMVQFPNPNGLEAIGGNLFAMTVASGEPIFEDEGDIGSPSALLQGVLEMSNVSIAEEMIGLILAQRAFDTNSRGITTSDEMLQTANQLKR